MSNQNEKMSVDEMVAAIDTIRVRIAAIWAEWTKGREQRDARVEEGTLCEIRDALGYQHKNADCLIEHAKEVGATIATLTRQLATARDGLTRIARSQHDSMPHTAGIVCHVEHAQNVLAAIGAPVAETLSAPMTEARCPRCDRRWAEMSTYTFRIPKHRSNSSDLAYCDGEGQIVATAPTEETPQLRSAFEVIFRRVACPDDDPSEIARRVIESLAAAADREEQIEFSVTYSPLSATGIRIELSIPSARLTEVNDGK